MSYREPKEWAIQDEATGEWGATTESIVRMAVTRVESSATQYATYREAASAIHTYNILSPTVRIVPAPPREMTDEECWAWFRSVGATENLRISGGPSGLCVWRERWHAGYFAMPCDAIRAARKKLEGR